jgi:hypothetical protein
MSEAHPRTASGCKQAGARLCVKHSRSDRDSTLKSFATLGIFQQDSLAKLLRLVPHEAGHSRAPGAVSGSACNGLAQIFPLSRVPFLGFHLQQ